MTWPTWTGRFKYMFYSCACSRWKSHQKCVALNLPVQVFCLPTINKNVLKVNVENSKRWTQGLPRLLQNRKYRKFIIIQHSLPKNYSQHHHEPLLLPMGVHLGGWSSSTVFKLVKSRALMLKLEISKNSTSTTNRICPLRSTQFTTMLIIAAAAARQRRWWWMRCRRIESLCGQSHKT